MNNAPTAAGEDCILASLERPSNYRLYYYIAKGVGYIEKKTLLYYNIDKYPGEAGLMNLAKINEVIKASPAIQIQSRISLLQRRAWNVLLANAYNELPNPCNTPL